MYWLHFVNRFQSVGGSISFIGDSLDRVCCIFFGAFLKGYQIKFSLLTHFQGKLGGEKRFMAIV